MTRSRWKDWKPVKANLHLPGLKEMVALSVEGVCPFCGDPAEQRSMTEEAIQLRRKGKKSDWNLMCGAPECVTAYHRCHNRDRYGCSRPFKKLKKQRGIRKYVHHMSDPSGTPR